MQVEQIRFELIKAVKGPNAWQSVRHLMFKLRKQESNIVLQALLEIFFLDRECDYQEIAGGLLWKLKPKYNRNIREDIRRSLQNWNVSVEELPWYFAEVKGIETVRDEVKSLLKESLDGVEIRKANTFLYWLSAANPKEFKTELNQRWNGRLRG